MTEPLLSVQDLSVAFRQGGRDMLAVDRVSFDVMPGETVALMLSLLIFVGEAVRDAFDPRKTFG